jgi:phosphotransferase system  glucose/maltose/N-acetylglucosamine-specific IIC component
MKYLQKLGKALMLPVACLPICGILMGILSLPVYHAGRRG